MHESIESSLFQGCCNLSQVFSHVWLFVIPRASAHQAPLSFTISWSLFNLKSIELVMPSNHSVLCHPLLLLPSIFPSIRVFSNGLAYLLWLLQAVFFHILENTFSPIISLYDCLWWVWGSIGKYLSAYQIGTQSNSIVAQLLIKCVLLYIPYL